tara:strand:- start:1208 stop:1810 length:603 start_codon:yes stop_codon:yes gene_type:complete
MVQLAAVTSVEGLESFVRSYVLHNLEWVELPLLRLAYEATRENDGDALERLDQVSLALRTPEELRQATTKTGRQRLELLSSVMDFDELYPDAWQSLIPRLRHTQITIVAGLEAFLNGVPVEAAMQAFGFTSISGVVSAAVKTQRLGQTAVQRILHQASLELHALTERSLQISESEIGAFTPLLDIASARHKRAFCRLFLS